MQPAFLPERLTSDRLLLRRPLTKDHAELFGFYSDRVVARWLNWPVYTDKAKFVKNIERYNDLWNIGEEFYWVIELTATSSIVGSIACGVSGSDADIGFMLDKAHQGHGYATEAARTLLDALTASDRIDRVVALTAVGNEASVAVLEKVGMKNRGVATAFMVCPNISDKPCDALIYAIDCKQMAVSAVQPSKHYE